MAKALIGYLGGSTTQQQHDTATLRRRIADLEAEVLRLKIENDGLLTTVRAHVDEVTASDLLQPLAR